MYHPELAGGRWFTLSIAEQLGNVGSEYERALSCKERHDAERFQHAFARLMELLDLTIADPRWQNHRLKELTLLKEFIRDELCNEVREYPDQRDLREYFLSFALLANKERAAARNRQSAIGTE
ncbi:MAG TPA: hypothetical protein VHD88_06035 [Pyrinomonadaceae bacterium]|nr:hypothetical protein [Pyrinomonadaceae bacterium]